MEKWNKSGISKTTQMIPFRKFIQWYPVQWIVMENKYDNTLSIPFKKTNNKNYDAILNW